MDDRNGKEFATFARLGHWVKILQRPTGLRGGGQPTERNPGWFFRIVEKKLSLSAKSDLQKRLSSQELPPSPS
jgi:hypothetical protein